MEISLKNEFKRSGVLSTYWIIFAVSSILIQSHADLKGMHISLFFQTATERLNPLQLVYELILLILNNWTLQL